MKQFAALLLPLVLAPLLSGCVSSDEHLIQLDDSYTVSSRLLANEAEHSEFVQPTVTAIGGQRILYDRLYVTIGSRELHCDVFLPPKGGANGQALVLVHGGAWRSGNKSNIFYIASLLAQRGYAVVLPEIRLAPEALYPAALADINEALAWTAAHALEFEIDPHRIAVGGESSGGQMAALIAYTGGTALYSADGEPAPTVNALIDIDGVLDMTTPLALKDENAAGRNSSFARWVGGSWEQKSDVWRQASAAHHLSPASPPTLVISGGDPRFTAGIETVLPYLESRGTAASEVAFPGLPHTFWLFEPYASRVVEAIDNFLREAVPVPPRATGE